jgi:hypothetical protein
MYQACVSADDLQGNRTYHLYRGSSEQVIRWRAEMAHPGCWIFVGPLTRCGR